MHTVTGCYANGFIVCTKENSFLGGLIGNISPGTVSSCYANVNITGAGGTSTDPANTTLYTQAGGLVGRCNNSNVISITDVTNDSWFHDAVKYVYENNLMNGAETYAFEPDTATTRGMIVTVLFRMEGSPTGFEKAAFSDVAADSYYANAIGWGFKNGIVKGYDKSLYGPEDNITREQLASILYRYAEFKKYDLNKTTALEKFADGKGTSDYAKNAISWAVGNGLLAGKGDSVLDPTGEATRAEVATILMRFDDKFGKKA